MPGGKLQPLGVQLSDLLEAEGVSIRELARRMAAADGTNVEAKRRWISKFLAGELTRPKDASLRKVEKALAVRPQTLQAPPREPRAVAAAREQQQIADMGKMLRQLDDRLRQLEASVVRVPDLGPLLRSERALERVVELLAQGNRREALRVLSEELHREL